MKSVAVNGAELWYADRGSGLPLVLVHGFPLDHTMWAGQVAALAATTNEFLVGEAYWAGPRPARPAAPPCRVIAPDLRGFGRSVRKGDRHLLSEAPSGPFRQKVPVPFSPPGADTVTMDQFADDLAGLLDALAVREPVVLCGLSMGGYIAFQFWRRYAARLRGLILCDTRAVADTPEAAAARHDMAQRVLREGPGPLLEGMLPRLFAETTHQRQPHMVQQVQHVMMSGDPRGIAAAARGMAQRPDMTPMLGEIRCPTLVLVGENDVISTPAEMRGIAAAIPGANYVEIPAAGHLAPLENAAQVNAEMAKFLTTL